MSGEGGGETQDMSVLPGEHAGAEEQGLKNGCLPPQSPSTASTPASLTPLVSWAISQDYLTLLGFFRGLTDPTGLQAPPGQVHGIKLKSSGPSVGQP